MPTSNWTAAEIPDLSGRTAIVTGANSGIGLEAARAIAARGANVVLAVRDTNRGADAARTISGSVEVRQLDLADLASVRAFAEDWTSSAGGDIHLLINNAGIMAPPLGRTADDFELQFGTNHLGPFALTNLLLPQVTGRVVTVSSAAHRAGRISLDDPSWLTRRYQRWLAYGQSKLANLLFTTELQRRLELAGSSVIATAAHPGWAATNLQKSDNPIGQAAMNLANRVIAQDAAGGALPTLYAAVADIPGNSFVGPGGVRGLRGAPTLAGRSEAATDTLMAKKLWDLSEELTGVTWPL